jgi:hypothetical protein
MTSQEKAKELVDKFLYANKGHFYQDCPLEDLEAAKECSLVAVNELCILAAFFDKKIVDYLEEVKQEIEKL